MWWHVLAIAVLAGTASAAITSVTIATATFIRGNPYDVTWSASVDGTSVKIELFRRSGGAIVGEATGVTTSPFPFTVPFDVPTASSAYDIRVVNEADSGDSRTANRYISVNPVASSFTFTYPTSSSTVGYRGSSMNIGWTTVGDIYTVDIQECTSLSPVVCTAVASNITNEGTFLWQLPADLRNGQHKLTISGNTFHPEHDRVEKTQTFTVQAAASSITFTYPTSSSTVGYRGSSMNIGWTTVGDIYTVDIQECTSLSPVVCTAIASNVTNEGSFPWQLPADLRTGQHRLTISGSTFHPKHDRVENTQTFTVQAAPSSITVKQPTANAVWYRGSQRTIEWESTGGIDSVDIQVCNSAESDCTTVATDVPNIWTFSWPIPATHQTTVSQKIVISTNRFDPAGESKTGKSSMFYIRAEPTSLSLKAPSSSSARIYRGMPYSITWESIGPIDSVDLIYYPYRDSPLTAGAVIVSDTPNDGEYAWQVPNDLPLGAYHKIRIQANRFSPAADPTPVDSSNIYFYAMPTSLKLSAPTTSRRAYRGTTVNITWATTGPITALSIEYKRGTSGLYEVIVSNTPNRGFYLWQVPSDLPTSGIYYMRLTPSNAHPAADPQPEESAFYISDPPSSSSGSGGSSAGPAVGAMFAIGAVVGLGMYARAAIAAKRKKKLEENAGRQAKMASGKAEAMHPYTQEGIPPCYFPGYQPPAPEIAPISPQSPRLQQTGPDLA